METASNKTANVSVGKGMKGGYLFRLPKGAKVPTDVRTPLPDSKVNLGFVDSEGVTITDETDSSTLADMNGDVIVTTSASETHTWAFLLAEVKADSLREQYGHNNVIDADGMITVEGKSGGFEAGIYVLEMVLRDNRRARLVLPNAEHQSTDELAINSETIFGRTVTVIGMPDENGASFYYFFDSTETPAPPAVTAAPEGEYLGVNFADLGDFKVEGTLISGTANETDCKKFSSNPDEQHGFYLGLNYEPLEGSYLTSSRTGVRKAADSDPWLIFLGKEAPDAVKTITIDHADGRRVVFDVDIAAAVKE